MMRTVDYLNAVNELNERIYKKDSNPDVLFEYRTTGMYHFIHFGELSIYCNEEDGTPAVELVDYLTCKTREVMREYTNTLNYTE